MMAARCSMARIKPSGLTVPVSSACCAARNLAHSPGLSGFGFSERQMARSSRLFGIVQTSVFDSTRVDFSTASRDSLSPTAFATTSSVQSTPLGQRSGGVSAAAAERLAAANSTPVRRRFSQGTVVIMAVLHTKARWAGCQGRNSWTISSTRIQSPGPTFTDRVSASPARELSADETR